MPISVSHHQRVAVIALASPPVNALGRELAEALHHQIASLGQDPEARAIVLSGAGRCFCAGADISGLQDDGAQSHAIRALIEALDASPVPIVASLHGPVLGGGLELALACDLRVAASDTRFGFPEVQLGLLPGAGGSQRAPRLLGVEAALELMTGGKPIGASRALELGLIDLLCETDPLSAAIQQAGSMQGRRRTRDRTMPMAAPRQHIAAAREAAVARCDGRALAAASIVDCVEAAVDAPFEQGLALEQQRFDALLGSSESRAFRHLFLSERSAAHLPSPPNAAHSHRIERVAVIGAGLMGSGIASAVLAAGLPVNLVDPDPGALQRAQSQIAAGLRRDVGKLRLVQAEADARMSRLSLHGELAEAVAEADLVIEAVLEDLALKREVFGALDALSKPGSILASNTSTLDVDAIASVVGDPGRVLGMHFFSPAQVMRLVEVVRGAATRPEVLACALAFARRLGKVGVVAGVCDGFIGNRMFEEYLRQAYFLLEEGALPWQVDRAMEAFGFAMGPFRVMDLAGQDIGWRIRQRRAIEQPERPYSSIPDLVCQRGRFGQKTGAGFYRYPDGRAAVIDPEIDALVIEHSARIGCPRRPISDGEIVSRCVLALVNEGACILQEGIAWRPADIDVVWTAGYGFPAHRGGPMFHADSLGLDQVLDSIERFSAGYQGWAWQPAALLQRLVAESRSLGDLNV